MCALVLNWELCVGSTWLCASLPQYIVSIKEDIKIQKDLNSFGVSAG
jgi:hypothetical protein